MKPEQSHTNKSRKNFNVRTTELTDDNVLNAARLMTSLSLYVAQIELENSGLLDTGADKATCEEAVDLVATQTFVTLRSFLIALQEKEVADIFLDVVNQKRAEELPTSYRTVKL